MADVVRSAIDERRVARITIARPERKNAFDAEVIAQLTKAVDGVPADARCVVLASEGDTFCAGADLGWMRSMADFSREENLADSGALAELFASLDRLEMPIVARIQGAAIGGGAGLVAMADIAVAAEAATFAFRVALPSGLPRGVTRYLDALPAAIIAALAGPAILVPGGTVMRGPELVAALVVIAVVAWRRNLLAGVLSGVATVALLRLVLAA